MTSRQKKKVTHRAGVIPYYIKNKKVLMMFMKPGDPEFGGDVFQIAKGKYEEGESSRTAAFREGHEELGLKLENVALIYELGTFLGYTTIFLAQVMDPDDFDPFHFETGETKWLTAEEFAKVGRDLHKPIVRKAVEFIKEECGV